MKVVHVVTGLGTGGAEMMLWKLLAAIPAARHQAVVVSLLDRGTIGPRIESLGHGVHALRMRRTRPSATALGRLRALLLRERPDLVQGWMYHGNLAALVGARLAFGRRVPVVWNVRQSLQSTQQVRWLTGLVVWTGARWSSAPRAVIYNSRAAAVQHESIGYDRRRTRVIANGFDTSEFRPDSSRGAAIRKHLGLHDGELVIGMIARWHPQKDHATFLNASRMIADAMPNARFVLAGRGVEGSNEHLARLVSEQRLGERVTLLGERTDTPNIYNAMDVACLSSAWGEGFPNVLGEAMACGVPCVATDVGDSAWVLGDTGRIVPVGRPDELARACLDLLQAGRLDRHMLGARCRERICGHFDLSSIAGQYADLYDAVVEGREGQ